MEAPNLWKLSPATRKSRTRRRTDSIPISLLTQLTPAAPARRIRNGIGVFVRAPVSSERAMVHVEAQLSHQA